MLLAEICQYLDSKSIIQFDETGMTGDCFMMALPSSPSEAVAVYSNGGFQSDSKLGFRDPTVQFLIRGGLDPRPAYNRSLQIYKALHGFHSDTFVQGGFFIVSCFGVQSGPIHIGVDENGLHKYSLNFDLTIK